MTLIACDCPTYCWISAKELNRDKSIHSWQSLICNYTLYMCNPAPAVAPASSCSWMTRKKLPKPDIYWITTVWVSCVGSQIHRKHAVADCAIVSKLRQIHRKQLASFWASCVFNHKFERPRSFPATQFSPLIISAFPCTKPSTILSLGPQIDHQTFCWGLLTC